MVAMLASIARMLTYYQTGLTVVSIGCKLEIATSYIQESQAVETVHGRGSQGFMHPETTFQLQKSVVVIARAIEYHSSSDPTLTPLPLPPLPPSLKNCSAVAACNAAPTCDA